jgi:fructose-bisphosphate aldolase / 6-deoxy-5-ketofructose 1-phosphate synthase
LEHLEKQVRISGASGLAIGRNLHQRPLEEARRLSAAISAILSHDKNAPEAWNIYSNKEKLKAKASRFLGLF